MAQGPPAGCVCQTHMARGGPACWTSYTLTRDYPCCTAGRLADYACTRVNIFWRTRRALLSRTKNSTRISEETSSVRKKQTPTGARSEFCVHFCACLSPSMANFDTSVLGHRAAQPSCFFCTFLRVFQTACHCAKVIIFDQQHFIVKTSNLKFEKGTSMQRDIVESM